MAFGFVGHFSQLFAKRAEADLNHEGDLRRRMQVNGQMRRLIGRSIEQMFLQAHTDMDTTVITLLNSIKRCVQRARPNRSYARVSKTPLSTWMKRRASKQHITSDQTRLFDRKDPKKGFFPNGKTYHPNAIAPPVLR